MSNPTTTTFLHLLSLLLLLVLLSSLSHSTDARLAYSSKPFSRRRRPQSTNPRGCQVVVVGAGIGGIYSAYRLSLDSSTVSPRNICIFEAQARPGGRILTLTGSVPSFDDFTIDLGAYRYGRSRHWMMRSIIEDVLGYDWQCYTDPLDQVPVTGDRDSCPSADLRILSTRGVVFGMTPGNGSDTGMTAADAIKADYNTRDLPYVIPRRGQWGMNGQPLTAPRKPSDLLVGPGSVLPEIAERWTEFDNEKDFNKAMTITDEILAKITRNGMYTYRNGKFRVPYYKVSLWQVARDVGFDSDELKFFIDRSGPVTPYTLHTNVERLVTVQLREAALAKYNLPKGSYKGLVVPVVKDNRPGSTMGRRRAGMKVLYQGLLTKLEKAGVRVFYGHRVSSIRRTWRNKSQVVLSMTNGKKVYTNKVVVNSAKADIDAMGLESEPVKSADMNTKLTLARILPMPGTKMYCFWDDAWWVTKLNMTAGVVRMADDTLYQARYHDGDVICRSSSSKGMPTKCRGALLVSYASGSVNSGVPVTNIRSFNAMPFTPSINTDAIINIPNRNLGKQSKTKPTSVHEQLLFEDVHRQLRDAHRSTFEAMGYDTNKMDMHIPAARGCVASDFKDFGHQVDVGSGRGGNDNRRFTRPVKDLDIALVNEGWSEFRGWAEGSLVAAERALFHQFGVAPPKWLNARFHRSVIQQFNRGRAD